ncbi:MAG TPA: zinc-binding dehydrogenase [Streptosporangiaceae bacterium]
MRAAGVTEFGGPVRVLDLPGPRPLRPDEVLLDVRASGVGNWDEFIRTGGWDTAVRPPMALGVEAAGLVAAVGSGVSGVAAGDRAATLSVPLRQQGAWAGQLIAAAADVAIVPPAVPWAAAAALPIPALTADQALAAAGVRAGAGQTVLVHGAGGVTGGLLVQLAVYLGATVIATAGAASAGRVAALGAAHVLDYRAAGWPGQARALAGSRAAGVDAAVNAAPDGAADALAAVRDGGGLATITDAPPAAERGITARYIEVVPDGRRLGVLAGLLAAGALELRTEAPRPLAEAAAALDRARHGAHGGAVVLDPRLPG